MRQPEASSLSNSTKPRVDWYDFARGASIILVVLFHTGIALNSYGLVNEVYWKVNNVLSFVRMPIFFFISGVLARNILLGKTARFRARVALLTYILIIWNIIQSVTRFIVRGDHFSIIEFLHSLVLPSSTLWFIWALAIYAILSRPLMNRRGWSLFAISLAISQISYARLFYFDDYVLNNILRYFPFYCSGVLIGSRPHIMRCLTDWRAMIVSALIFSIIYYSFVMVEVPSPSTYALRLPLAMLGILLGASASERICRFAVFKTIPCLIGRRTLEIYVAHTSFILILVMVFDDYLRILPHADLLAVPLVLVSSIALSLMLKVVLDKCGMGATYRLPAPWRQRLMLHPARPSEASG